MGTNTMGIPVQRCSQTAVAGADSRAKPCQQYDQVPEAAHCALQAPPAGCEGGRAARKRPFLCLDLGKAVLRAIIFHY
eukprot:3250806-Prymnesium_polylepis.1